MPRQFQFCGICRQNHNAGRAHVYTRAHQRRLAAKLEKALNTIKEVKFFLKNVRRLQPGEESRNKVWCHFCESEIDELGSRFVCEKAIQHYSSEEHSKKLKAYWANHGADLSKRSLFSISNSEKEKWEEKCRTLPEGETPLSPPVERQLAAPPSSTRDNIHPISPLSSSVSLSFVAAPSPLASLPLPAAKDGNKQTLGGSATWTAQKTGESATWQPVVPPCSAGEGSQGSPLLQEASVPLEESAVAPGGSSQVVESAAKTVISQHGILQNPSGQHLGQRVWGGGIVKFRKGEWIPWPIDLDDESPNWDYKNQTNLGAIPTTNNAQIYEMSATPSMPIRHTREASAEGLTVITPPPLLPGEKNVHSDAPPPWLLESELSLAARAPTSSSSIAGTSSSASRKRRNPKRVGAAWAEQRLAEMARVKDAEGGQGEVERALHENERLGGGDTWLPSFGRVWQSGSRKDSRKEFEAEKKRRENMVPRAVKVKPYVSKRQEEKGAVD